jgi:hypothetical protein
VEDSVSRHPEQTDRHIEGIFDALLLLTRCYTVPPPHRLFPPYRPRGVWIALLYSEAARDYTVGSLEGAWQAVACVSPRRRRCTAPDGALTRPVDRDMDHGAQHHGDPSSVHLCSWPQPEEFLFDDEPTTAEDAQVPFSTTPLHTLALSLYAPPVRDDVPRAKLSRRGAVAPASMLAAWRAYTRTRVTLSYAVRVATVSIRCLHHVGAGVLAHTPSPLTQHARLTCYTQWLPCGLHHSTNKRASSR